MAQAQVLRDIKTLNNQAQTNERNMYLNDLLTQQNAVMGVIISKPTGKCIGTIENSGKINHVSHKDAKSPYSIVVKPMPATPVKAVKPSTPKPSKPNDHHDTTEPPGNIVVNAHGKNINIESMLMKNDLQGLSAKDVLVRVTNLKNVKVLGQTVDIKGKIVGLIVRIDRSNNYIQTQPSAPLPSIPILAILHKVKNNLTAPVKKPVAKPPAPPQPITVQVQMMPGQTGQSAQAPPTTKQAAPAAPKPAAASNTTTSKIAPNSVPDEQCIEPVVCSSPPAEPVVSGTTASKPSVVTNKSDTKPTSAVGSALSGVSAKMSSLWHRV